MNLKRISLFIIVLLVSYAGYSQSQRQNNYIVNPYLYLPTAAGAGESAQLFLGVRKQWLGIDGSPTTSVLSYDQSVMANLGAGAQFKFNEMGPITDFSLSATGNYKLELAEKQYVNFALTGGAAYAAFDLAAATDPSEPALSTIPENKMGAVLKLGVAYTFDSFQAFSVLPNLLGADLVFGESSSSSTSPFSEWLIGAKYNLSLNEKVAFEPQILYLGITGFANRLEGICSFRYEQKVLVGASYRQSLGLGALVGFAVSNDLMVSYAFEEGGITSNSGISNTTHEIGLTLSL